MSFRKMRKRLNLIGHDISDMTSMTATHYIYCYAPVINDSISIENNALLLLDCLNLSKKQFPT